jgi:hypothetical protein
MDETIKVLCRELRTVLCSRSASDPSSVASISGRVLESETESSLGSGVHQGSRFFWLAPHRASRERALQTLVLVGMAFASDQASHRVESLGACETNLDINNNASHRCDRGSPPATHRRANEMRQCHETLRVRADCPAA